MRIESIRIRNLRSFVDETIHLDDYTCLVGQNGLESRLCSSHLIFSFVNPR